MAKQPHAPGDDTMDIEAYLDQADQLEEREAWRVNQVAHVTDAATHTFLNNPNEDNYKKALASLRSHLREDMLNPDLTFDVLGDRIYRCSVFAMAKTASARIHALHSVMENKGEHNKGEHNKGEHNNGQS